MQTRLIKRIVRLSDTVLMHCTGSVASLSDHILQDTGAYQIGTPRIQKSLATKLNTSFCSVAMTVSAQTSYFGRASYFDKKLMKLNVRVCKLILVGAIVFVLHNFTFVVMSFVE